MTFSSAVAALAVAPVYWVVVSEITSDRQFAAACAFHYANGILLSVDTEYLIKYMGPDGMFLVYAGATFGATLFYIFVLKETQGLTDREKKELYLPNGLASEKDYKDVDLETVEESSS